MQKIVKSSQPSIGLVIGTFAAAPYIHLHLESWKRNYPSIKLLVHDDSSPVYQDLEILAKQYGADIVSTSERSPHFIGDLSAFYSGFRWAQDNKLDFLIKFSRRFIPLYNWVEPFQRLAYELQYPTYSSRCINYSFGFRTECVAMHVNSWEKSGAIKDIHNRVLSKEPNVFVEGYLHQLAYKVLEQEGCDQVKNFEKFSKRCTEIAGYGDWWVGGVSRTLKSADVLWHNSDSAQDYANISNLYGLPYTSDSFRDPNSGFGTG